MSEFFEIAIPNNLENLQLPDPALLKYYQDAERRTYWIDCGIDDDTLDVVRAIMEHNREDRDKEVSERKPIWLLINSDGGDVPVMWSIMNAIMTSKTPVNTVVICGAFSAAAMILGVGHKRYALKGSSCMVHNGSVSLRGQTDSVNVAKKFYDKLDVKATNAFLERTKINPRTYKKKAVSDWYMDENEMLENGVIDEIVQDLDDIL
ncbi:MAG: ATP-dependent Clp protease proteolytic subunit [Candidatus Gastranaerophilales bacterium]|nr:ATP-dependent Clp protease proteolytic subunit [Candidatus Gastranaerophilales bacterium]